MSAQPNASSTVSAQDTTTQGKPGTAGRALKQFYAGAVAGAFSKTATAPLARLTILYQVQGMPGVVPIIESPGCSGGGNGASRVSGGATTSGASGGATRGGGSTARGARMPVVHSIREIVRREGLLSLWKGNGAMLLHRVPYSGTNFYAYETAMGAILKLPSSLGLDEKESIPYVSWFYRWKLHCLVAGAAAASVAATVAYPLDLLRTRLAVQDGRSLGIDKTFLGILHKEGVRGLYRGLGPTLAQVSPNIASSFWSYELALDAWRRVSGRSNNEKAPPLVTVAAGAFAGFVSSTLTYPLDLARRRCQVESTASRKTLIEHLRYIQKTKGVRGLYSGIIFEYYKVVPGMAITYVVYSLLSS